MRVSPCVVTVLVAAISACPPGPPPVDVPACGVTNVVEADQALFLPATPVQFVLEGGDICTPGTADGCEESFDACDVDAGDVAVASVRRETLFVRALNSPLTLFDARIEGDCPDVYVEGFFPDTFVGVGVDTSVTIVVNATSTGPCTAQLVFETDASNIRETNPVTGNHIVSIDVVANRVEGGLEGCTAAVACCCDFAQTRLPAQCDDGRLACVDQSTLLFTDQCDSACGAQQSFPWVIAEDDALLVGPVPVDDSRDFVVLHPSPCTLERFTRDRLPVWSTTLSALDTCADVALAGAAIVVTGDGREVLVDVTTGIEGATRDNEGPTVTARSPEGALTASRRNDTDLVVRQLNTIGAVTSELLLDGVQPDVASPHFVAALSNGDVIVSFVRVAGAPAVELPAVGGGLFALGDADVTALLQLDATGLVRRALVMQTSVVANVDARNNAYVMCGGTQAAGALVELGRVGEPANAIGSFGEARGFFVRIDDAGVVTLDEDSESNLTSVCGFDAVGDLFLLSTSNTALTLRATGAVRELTQGRAVAIGALLDDADLVVVAVHGGVAGQEVLPLYPAGVTPIESGSFTMRTPRDILGL